MKLKLYRDNVVSMTDKGDLVGVYVKVNQTKDRAIYRADKTLGQSYGRLVNIKGEVEVMLAEMPPEKADAIIKLWNGR